MGLKRKIFTTEDTEYTEDFDFIANC